MARLRTGNGTTPWGRENMPHFIRRRGTTTNGTNFQHMSSLNNFLRCFRTIIASRVIRLRSIAGTRRISPSTRSRFRTFTRDFQGAPNQGNHNEFVSEKVEAATMKGIVFDRNRASAAPREADG